MSSAWDRSMEPRPSVPNALAHFVFEMSGALLVMGATIAVIWSLLMVGGASEQGVGDQVIGGGVLVIAVGVFWLGRYLMREHAVPTRRRRYPPRKRSGGWGDRPWEPRDDSPSGRGHVPAHDPDHVRHDQIGHERERVRGRHRWLSRRRTH